MTRDDDFRIRVGRVRTEGVAAHAVPNRSLPRSWRQRRGPAACLGSLDVAPGGLPLAEAKGQASQQSRA